MANKKIRLQGEGNQRYSGGVGHSGGVTVFTNGVAIVTEATFKELEENGIAVEALEDIDPEKTVGTSFFTFDRYGHVAALEKEALSQQNVADHHSLGTKPMPEDFIGRYVVNNDDSTVPITNANSAIAVGVDVADAGNPPIFGEGADEDAEERGNKVREKAKKIRKNAGFKDEAAEEADPASEEASAEKTPAANRNTLADQNAVGNSRQENETSIL